MYSKAESKKIRQAFWTSFGVVYPQKWLLYHTKIKDVSLKFTFTTKKAQVSIDIECTDDVLRQYYFEKFMSLETILKTEYIEAILLEKNYLLENGKVISRIYIEKDNVSIHNKKTWQETMLFLSDHMSLLEAFFIAYKDLIKD